jgi:putative phosphoribosyl transferase
MICLPGGHGPWDDSSSTACYHLKGRLTLPPGCTGVVVVAWEDGTRRGYEIRRQLVQSLAAAGMATCEVDLRDPGNERHSPADLRLLSERLVAAIDYLGVRPDTAHLRRMLVGGELAAAAAVRAAVDRGDALSALVCCAGDVRRAAIDPEALRVPTMLLVPSEHPRLVKSNERFFWSLNCDSQYAVIRGAGRRFREPGTLVACQRAVTQWCTRNLEPVPRRLPWRARQAAFASRN